jgi:hypothetical protein
MLWGLSLLSSLITSGVVHHNHVLIQAVNVFAGTIGNQWPRKKIPWADYPAWHGLCEALQHHGSPAALQLMRGHPNTEMAINPTTTNFICPSRAKIDRDAPVLSYAEGPQQNLINIFNLMLQAAPHDDHALLQFKTGGTTSIHQLSLILWFVC